MWIKYFVAHYMIYSFFLRKSNKRVACCQKHDTFFLQITPVEICITYLTLKYGNSYDAHIHNALSLFLSLQQKYFFFVKRWCLSLKSVGQLCKTSRGCHLLLLVGVSMLTIKVIQGLDFRLGIQTELWPKKTFSHSKEAHKNWYYFRKLSQIYQKVFELKYVLPIW